MFRTAFVILLALLTTAMPLVAQSTEELNFLTGQPDGRELRTMLSSWLLRKAQAALAARRGDVERWSGAADVTRQRQRLRARLTEALGGLPERTPLNARVTAALERPDHRIEKIIFESQPGFFVTANLYLPKGGPPPHPGILFPLGHEAGAKANPVWQQMLVTLARRGYVSLAWDTLGQGERIQLYDEDLRGSKLVRSTTEHTMQGIQCLLVGDSLARYTIWDGIRALDYLLSRKEVDPARIGCTGNSGGGTHTAYLAALDDRIHVAAPSCYLTAWGRLLETIGPQDAEQCLPGSLAARLDHADFVHAFAPRPYLILSAIRDFFSIAGARDTFAEARGTYTLLGAADKLDMVEADDGHGYSKPRRLAAYRWFDRWLKGRGEEVAEPEAPVAVEEALWCTPTGQVGTSLGGETVFSLNKKRAARLFQNSAPPSPDEVRRRIGFEAASGPLAVRSYGEITRTGYRIEKLVYESEPGILVPSLLFLPEKPAGSKPAAIFVHGRGKAAARPEAEELVRAGFVVLAIDARGFGETRSASDTKGPDWPAYFGDYDAAMTAILLGRTLIAMRALDIMRGVDLLAGRPEVDAARMLGFARDGGTAALAHAAALDPRLGKVALEGMVTLRVTSSFSP